LSGLSNVVLGWPLVAALAHTGGAAAMVVLLTAIISRTRPASDRSSRTYTARSSLSA
jgi:cytochrome c oxidase assembly protein subunit 15